MSLSCGHDLIDLLYNSLPLCTHVLFGLRLDSSKMFLKALVIVIHFLFFERTVHAYYLL